jgi:hypothetical protein
MFVNMCHFKPLKHLKLIEQILATNILIVPFFLRIYFDFKMLCALASIFICMYEVHMPYIEIFSILSCTRYPPIDPSLRQWEIYN